VDRSDWTRIVLNCPQPHFLQTWEWGEIKEKYGWKKDFMIWKDGETIQASAMILTRTATFLRGLLKVNICYVPRGPLFTTLDETVTAKVLVGLQHYADQHGAVFLKMDAEIVTHTGIQGEEEESSYHQGLAFCNLLQKNHWIFSGDQIQFRNTVIIDLDKSEDEMLAAMKQKTRYNIRLAQKRGVSVRTAQPQDFSFMYEMYLETSLRDGFIIRDKPYYLDVWNLFYEHDMARGLIAEVNGEAVAGLFLFYVGNRAWYFYGMSTDKHKEKMPNYLLQWQAMCLAKSKGCDSYDLWGAPDEFIETDRLWGVFRFKQGLGGTVQRTIGAWDYVPRKGLYFLYQQILPRISNWRRSHRRRTMAVEMDRD